MRKRNVVSAVFSMALVFSSAAAIGAPGASATMIQGDVTATATATCTTLSGAPAVQVDSTVTNGTNYLIYLDDVAISGAISVNPALPVATVAVAGNTTLTQTLLEPITGSVTVTWTYHINGLDPTATATVTLPDCAASTTTTSTAPTTTTMSTTTTVATSPATAARPVTATPTYTG